MVAYRLSNGWDGARRRLALLEHQLDPMSQRRLMKLGVGRGWRCLEVGGGGGSVTRWLCGQVGATGHVTATDIDTRFLQEIDEPILVVRRHDILTENLPAAQFDLVHARWLLHHLPQPERVIARLVAALRPGGWLLIEEPDFFPVEASTSQLYIDFMMALTRTILAPSGRDGCWARTLPTLLAELRLSAIGAEGDFTILNGGSPMAEFFQVSAQQMRDEIISSGALNAERFDAAVTLLEDPKFWTFGCACVAVWGRRPTAGWGCDLRDSLVPWSRELALPPLDLRDQT